MNFNTLKPYPAYRASGVPWLGDIPNHWKLQRVKWLHRNQKELNRGRTSTNVLSLTLRGVVNNNPDDPEGLVPADYSTYQMFRQGDLVFKLIDLENLRTSRVGIVHEDGIMSSAYVRLVPHHPGRQRYFFHQFFDLYQRGVFNQLGAGVRSTLGAPDLLNLPILAPDDSEQAAVVRFVEHVDQRIRRYVAAKRRMIALLTEQKQAMIRHGLTRGLDPAVPLKPSDLPWLGPIPRHWEVWRIGRLAKIGNGSTPSRSKPEYWNNGTYPWLNSSQVNRGVIDGADQFVTEAALRECHLPKVPAGSVLVAITGQGKTRGTSAMLKVEATINQHIAFITPRVPKATSAFLHLALTAAYSRLRALSEDSGSTKGAITCEDLKRFKVPIPPVPEQDALCTHLASATQTLADSISRLEREVLLVLQYRTRLIADVMTGKLDVREAASLLPEAPIGTVDEPGDLAEVTAGLIEEPESVAEETEA